VSEIVPQRHDVALITVPTDDTLHCRCTEPTMVKVLTGKLLTEVRTGSSDYRVFGRTTKKLQAAKMGQLRACLATPRCRYRYMPQYQNNRSVVLVPDFPSIGEQLKLGRVFGRSSGTEACKRPYQPASTPELRDCPQPTEGEGGFFFYFSAASSHRFLFNIAILVHSF
jgi:hypothetical protein